MGSYALHLLPPRMMTVDELLTELGKAMCHQPPEAVGGTLRRGQRRGMSARSLLLRTRPHRPATGLNPHTRALRRKRGRWACL